eukprot:313417-Rhodomonas_salina.3
MFEAMLQTQKLLSAVNQTSLSTRGELLPHTLPADSVWSPDSSMPAVSPGWQSKHVGKQGAYWSQLRQYRIWHSKCIGG